MRLFHVASGVLVETADGWFRLAAGWDAVVNRDDVETWVAVADRRGDADGRRAGSVARCCRRSSRRKCGPRASRTIRSRTARMEESKSAGGGDFYDRVYEAARPELFFKATPHRVRGHGEPVRIRKDSTLERARARAGARSSAPRGTIVGYTIGNDMSSRDIEGENPLYLPQAKVYDGCCALGPGALRVVVAAAVRRPRSVWRSGGAAPAAFEGATTAGVAEAHADPSWSSTSTATTRFPNGCVLLTGTGIVPPDEFTLAAGDEIAITIGAIGTLVNVVG